MLMKTRNRRILALVVLLLSCIVLVVALVVAWSLSNTQADCIWSATAQAWIDENTNGVWDSGELPLAGVQFRIDDVRNNYTDVGKKAISDDTGKARLEVWLPGCPSTEFQVYAEGPSGYRLVTHRCLRADEGPVAFGFGRSGE